MDDLEACSLTGDEVVKWNGHNLRGLTFDQVYDVIFDSKMDPRVELMVQRPIRSGGDQRMIGGILELSGVSQQGTQVNCHSRFMSLLKCVGYFCSVLLFMTIYLVVYFIS